MRLTKRTLIAAVFGAALLLAGTGCKKKVIATAPTPVEPVKPAPPPPPPPKPAAARIDAFAVEPATIQQGQSATLRWTVANATAISIDQGIGNVPANGTRTVTPNASTTYTLTANSPGGNATRAVTLTVNLPPPPPPKPKPTAAPKISGRDMLEREARDAFFDYDMSDIRPDARTALAQNADLLKRIFAADPAFRVTLEGHCDERGSAEYNLGLGDRRSTSAKDYLVQLGVPSQMLTPISFGKDRPQCTDANEDCYQRNRRVHLSAAQ
jgi:peptidoglycan-associated lipoprotein